MTNDNVISEDVFGAVCFLALMDHHGDGYEEAHPSYVAEKMRLIDAGYDAYSYLDARNQRRVQEYAEEWGYEMPDRLST